MSDLLTPEKGIYHPNRGFMPLGWREALEAVTDYDPTLSLGRRDTDGEWLVCKKRDGQDPHPVLSLGKSPEPPSRDTIMRKLYEGDVRRNGARIVAAIERAQVRERDERHAAASQAAGEWSEYAEYFTRGGRG